jgi:YVTN family beta-propeller protein
MSVILSKAKDLLRCFLDGKHMLRLIWALLIAVSTSLSALADTLVVVNNGANSVSIIDTLTGQWLAALSVGRGPHEVAISRDGRSAYVAESGSPENYGTSVAVLDLAKRRFKSRFQVTDCKMPHDLRVSRDGKRLWIACAPTQTVVEMDANSGKHLKTWKTGADGGWMLEVSPDENTLLVAHLEGGGISFIDRRSGTVKFLRTAQGEMAFDVTPNGKEVWAANSQNNRLTVVDAAEKKELTQFALAGQTPVRLKFTPDGKIALIPLSSEKKLLLYDVQSRKLMAAIELPAAPKVTAVSKDGRRAYIGSPESDQVMVVDLENRKVLEPIKVGKQPDGVAVVERK